MKTTLLLLLTIITTNAIANDLPPNVSCFNAASTASTDAIPVEFCSHVTSLIEKIEDSLYVAQYNCNYKATVKTQIDSSTGICTVIDTQVSRVKF